MTETLVTLRARERRTDLALRVSTPTDAPSPPIILFSHGRGFSKDDYDPLARHWAANGFAVIQPSHLDSASMTMAANDPRLGQIWRSRVQDLKMVLDQLDLVEAAVGRLDRDRIAAAGHSFGGHTAAALLGARIADPANGRRVDYFDARVTAGLLLAPPGQGGAGGAELAPEWAARSPYLDVSFAEMTTQALVVVGGKDVSPMSGRGAVWHEDPYRQGPSPKWLWNLPGAGHWLGGIGGPRCVDGGDDSLQRVAAVQRVTLAYLRAALSPADAPSAAAWRLIAEAALPEGRLDSK